VRDSSAGAAHENGLEQFPAFGLAVLAAYVSGVDRDFAAKLALAHCTARLLYNVVYIMFVRACDTLSCGVGLALDGAECWCCVCVSLFGMTALAADCLEGLPAFRHVLCWTNVHSYLVYHGCNAVGCILCCAVSLGLPLVHEVHSSRSYSPVGSVLLVTGC
jgi:hypothetical protein